MATDISVTITPPAQKTVVIGNGITQHAVTHAPGGNDTLELYYATTGNLAYISGQIGAPTGVVLITGDQDIGGIKNFTERPTVNGTGVLLSGEASASSTGYLTGYVNKAETGNFYPTSNPSGYITGVDLSPYSTTSQLTGTSGFLQDQIISLNNGTGSFLTTGSADDRYVSSTLNQTVSGDKNFVSRPTVNGVTVLLSGDSLPSDTGYLIGYVLKIETGNFITTGTSGFLQEQINSINAGTGEFITGVDLSAYATNANLTGTSGFLQSQLTALDSLTGSYVTGDIVRPSDTGSMASTGYVALISGELQNQITDLVNSTGQYSSQFYPLTENPSGYITGVDLSLYSTTSSLTGVSGYLGGEINHLQSGSIEAIFNGFGSTLTTGIKGYIRAPFNGTITSYELVAKETGNLVIDIWKDTYDNFPPTVADTISNPNKPTLLAAQKNNDYVLSAWNRSISQGDWIAFNIDSVSSITLATLSLQINKS